MTCIGEDCDQIVRVSSSKEGGWGEAGEREGEGGCWAEEDRGRDWGEWEEGSVSMSECSAGSENIFETMRAG